MERKRLKYIDGIRFFAVMLVVIDHFNASLMQFNITIWGKSYIIPSTFANETLGILGVSLFFIISGVSLYYNYVNEFNIKTYFKKRFLNIYPTFWCYYLLVFLILFFRNKAFWFETTKTISTNRFLLSILGMDGFFLYQGRNFYLIGEWFLGCIILLYLLFPLLRICVKKYPIITWGVATIIYIVVVVYNPFKISLTRNLLIRGYDFLFGMLIVRYMPKNIDRKKQMSISLLFACIFIFGIGYQVADYRLKMCVITMTGISLFLFLIILLEKLDIGRFYFVKIVNKYSYDIFLLHHITLSLCFLYFAGHKYSLFEGATLTIIYIISLVIFIKSGRFIKGKIAMYFNQIVDF